MKNVKRSIFWPAFRVCSTQTLVRIYNNHTKIGIMSTNQKPFVLRTILSNIQIVNEWAENEVCRSNLNTMVIWNPTIFHMRICDMCMWRNKLWKVLTILNEWIYVTERSRSWLRDVRLREDWKIRSCSALSYFWVQ